VVGGLGPGPPNMDPPGFFAFKYTPKYATLKVNNQAVEGGGAKIEAPLHWQAPKVRGRSATGAERVWIWDVSPSPAGVFHSPAD